MNAPLSRVRTGIPGFDIVAEGGLPAQRATLVTGTPGTGKTILAGQFLAEGIRNGEPGIFVTCEVPAASIAQDLEVLGADIPVWERDRKWVFVDVSDAVRGETLVIGHFDLGALLARIRQAVEEVGAKRVALDSLDALSVRLQDPALVRNEVIRIVDTLAGLGVSCLMTAERLDEDGALTKYGVEGFEVANVIVLRNRLAASRRRRTIEILKFRGASHQRGEFYFTILPRKGIVVMPRTRDPLAPEEPTSTERVTTGTSELNEMLGGGPFRDNIILVSGESGTGKTTLAMEFAAGGVRAGERTLFVNFESVRGVLLRNARSIGHDFEALERQGDLRILAAYPESRSVDEHLIAIKEMVEAYRPQRVVVDGLQAMERIADPDAFRDFVVDLTAFLRITSITALLTSTGAEPASPRHAPHVSTVSDVILLLAYVDTAGTIDRAITALKIRGSYHDASVRKFWIDDRGLHVGDSLRRTTGILSPNLMAVLLESPARSPPDR